MSSKKTKVLLARKAQVAIWVIIALVLVGSVIIFFVFSRYPSSNIPPEGDIATDPQGYLETCVKSKVEETISIMLPQGGFVKPINKVVFNNTDIEYLCENRGYYDPCIQQHPMLLNEMKEEIKKEIEPFAWECFSKMKKELEGRKLKVNMKDSSSPKIDVYLKEDKISIEMKKELTILNTDGSRDYDLFEIEIASPAYNLAKIALEISAQEASYCYFEFVGYGVIYPRYKIKQYTMSDSTRIYSIFDKKSEKIMNIATRGCAIPAGA